MGSKGLLRGVLGCALAIAGACGGETGDEGGNSNAGTTAHAGGTGQTTGGTGTPGNAGRTGGGSGTSGTGSMMSGGTGSTPMGGMSGGAGTTAPAADGAPMCQGTGTALTGACRTNANGVYALKTELDVWWPSVGDPPVMDAGRGKITIWLKGDLSDVCEDGKGGKGIMHACGADVPPFVSDLTCDAYKLEFPDSLWDSPMMPTFETTGSTNGFTPGSVLDIAKATGLVGIMLNDTEGPWPTAAQTATVACKDAAGATKMGQDCFPDHDGDGKPGVTVSMRTSGMYMDKGCGGFNSAFMFRGAPPSVADGALAGGGAGGGRRASKFFIGLRNTLGGGGPIGDDCASGNGDAIGERIESRVWDCELDPASTDGGDTACTSEEAVFVDTNSPVYTILQKDGTPPANIDLPETQKSNGLMFDRTPSVGPKAWVKRLGNPGANISCADVRAAFN